MKQLLSILLLLFSTPFVYGDYPDEYPVYLQYLGFSKDEIRGLASGSIVTHSLENKLPGEIGFTVAKVIHVPPYYFRDYYTAIENFKSVLEFRQIGKFKQVPDSQDLEALQLSSQELQELVACHPQQCELKLSSTEISFIPHNADIGTDAGKQDVANAYKKILLDRLISYQKDGISGIGVYEDSVPSTMPATTIPAQALRLPHLAGYFPVAKKYLMEYPAHKNTFTPEFFFWAKESWGKKPVITIHHVFSQRVGKDYVLIKNLIYASHYFVSSIGVLHLINYSDSASPGTLLVEQNRILTDLKGSTLPAIGRNFLAANMQENLLSLIQHLSNSTETRYSSRFYMGFPYNLPPTDQR